MSETLNYVILIGSFVTAIIAISAALGAIIKWVKSPGKNAKDIEKLEKLHNDDMKQTNNEFCVLSYAIIAALDALRQQGYNGEVTKARGKIEKFINQRAHGQSDQKE